jgi:hypothetical protein
MVANIGASTRLEFFSMNLLLILTTMATLAILSLAICVTLTVLCVLFEWCETGVCVEIYYQTSSISNLLANLLTNHLLNLLRVQGNRRILCIK